ncbi:DNA helicase II, partial [Haemophilus influenzae]
NAKKLKMR